MHSASTWSHIIRFYLDGVGFAHRYNPTLSATRRISMCWRKRNEGNDLYCTAAGKKEGSGGRVAKFMVGIAHGKGVMLCEHYTERHCAKTFASFIEKHFPSCFESSNNATPKVFLQDGDPTQNSNLAMVKLEEIGVEMFSIPPRSPDLNPIENIFNIAKAQLRRDAINYNITREPYKEFVK